MIGAIACATGLGWLLIVGAEPLGLSPICGGAGFAAGWDGTRFVGLSAQWLVMIVTMALPCIAPAIVRVGRAERDHHGTLTAAMAFTLSYCAVMIAPACGAALWQLLADAENGPGGVAKGWLFALAAAFVLPRPFLWRQGQWAASAAGRFPMRSGLAHGVTGLASAIAMTSLQLAVGPENLVVMAGLAITMLVLKRVAPWRVSHAQ